MLLIAHPIHFRYVRATTAGVVACDPDHPKAITKRHRHPFAHLFEERTAALCEFDEFDDLKPWPLELKHDEDADGPIDWERLICGYCLDIPGALDDVSEWGGETCENFPIIEGVRR